MDSVARSLELEPIGRWINEGPSRVPLTDWYNTVTGKQEAFQARSVVGGVYIKALSNKSLAEKWSRADAQKFHDAPQH